MPSSIDGICRKFSDEWDLTNRSQLRQCIAQIPLEERTPALRRLIEIDVQRRRAAGQSPVVDDYAQLLGMTDTWIFELIGGGQPGSPRPAAGTTSISTMTSPDKLQSPVADGARAPVPSQIGRYRVVGIIGSGAFGQVLLARDDELDRLVAIKVPLNVASEAHISMHITEARAAAKLSHPGIVSLYDCGRLPDGRFYIVYEYVDGGTLRDELAQRLSIPRVVSVMTELADAVHHAHLNGLYHRDLKPSNILIDRNRHARIADFGLVLDETQQHRFAGQVSGSPAYMSPEQIRGESHFLDGRTDVWSLGVIFYEMLLGRRPFTAPTVEGLLAEILQRDPRPLRQIQDTIPRDLESICLNCLKRPLSERYATAADLAEDLRAWVRRQEMGLPAQGTSSSDVAREPIVVDQPHSSHWWKSLWSIALPVVAIAVAIMTIVIGKRPGHAPQPSPDANKIVSKETEKPIQPEPAHSQAVPSSLPIPVPTGAFLGPDTVPRGLWYPLLDREPKTLHWPLVPRNSELNYRPAKRELTISCDQSAMIELAQTAASHFKLRTKLHQATWTGGFGLFWGYHEIDNEGTCRYQSIGIQPYRVTIKSAPLGLAWTSVICTKDGWPLHTKVLSTFKVASPGPAECELQAVVQGGLLREIKWNGVSVGEIKVLDPSAQQTPEDSAGAMGITVGQSTVLVRESAIQFFEGESSK